MSGLGATPPPLPPEVLEEEKQRIIKQLELERGKSRLLYERAYQDYLKGISRTSTGERSENQHGVAPREEFYGRIRQAFEEAYALRAFREVMEDTTRHGTRPAPERMPSADSITTSLMKSGLPPEVVNNWLKKLDPEALGALIALNSNNPMLSQMAFAMNQRGNQQGLTVKDVIELNVALQKTQNQPNLNLDIPKLIETVRAQPQSASPKEIVDGTLEAIRTGIALASSGRRDEEERPERKGIFETLIQTPEGIKTAKELGLIGSDSSMMTVVAEMRKNDQDFQKTIRDSDRMWELRLEKLHAETAIKKAEIAESRRRTDMIGHSLQRVGGAIARAVAGAGEEGKTAEGKETEPGGVQVVPCPECGAPITIPPDKVNGVVKCAKCKAEFEVKPQAEEATEAAEETASNPEETGSTDSKTEEHRPKVRFL
jgi:hypothetical protein